jgi:hypothetical protein
VLSSQQGIQVHPEPCNSNSNSESNSNKASKDNFAAAGAVLLHSLGALPQLDDHHCIFIGRHQLPEAAAAAPAATAAAAAVAVSV